MKSLNRFLAASVSIVFLAWQVQAQPPAPNGYLPNGYASSPASDAARQNPSQWPLPYPVLRDEVRPYLDRSKSIPVSPNAIAPIAFSLDGQPIYVTDLRYQISSQSPLAAYSMQSLMQSAEGAALVHQTTYLAHRIRSIEDEKLREKLVVEYKESMNLLFDLDVKGREMQVQAMEKRLATMKSQLEKRKEQKSQIIDLQVQVTLNEADGLGFNPATAIQNYPGNRYSQMPVANPVLEAPPEQPAK